MDLNSILKAGAIKIKSSKDQVNKGSGFAFLPSGEPDFLYVLTAKHCIKGVAFNLSIRN